MRIKPHLKQVRHFSQFVCLGLFLFLFRQTDYSGTDTLPYAVNILFRLDPLVMATMFFSKQAVFSLLWPALIVIALTLIFGRVFCSWVCPMGALLDIFSRLLPKVHRKNEECRGNYNPRYLKYAFLIVLLAASVFGVQLIGFADPFSLLIRGMAFAIDPMINFLVSSFFDFVYMAGPAWMSDISEPVYEIFKSFLLPFRQSFFFLGFLAFGILTLIFAMELWGRRFWCKNLCPLGGLLALISTVSPFRRIPVKACKDCELCKNDCPMDAVNDENKLLFEECNLCMNCLEFCPRAITTFKLKPPKTPGQIDITRRQVVTSGFAALALPAVFRSNAASKIHDDSLIRPPGAKSETDFLAACVRCGECMKVCITNGIQPLFLEKGLEGMFTPKLIPRLGYCEFNCTLCSQVCPTGAIQKLNLKEKHAFVIGTAYFDINRCLVYAQKQNCIVCEEHCPTYDKAIKFKTVDMKDAQGKRVILKQPFVVGKNCIGCGICENVCPVQGTSAIRVVGKSPLEASQSGYG